MNIVLYKNSKILPWKNFKVDDIADYLATLDTYTFTNAQYIKHGLNVVYKLNLSQQYLDMGAYGDLVKYDYMSCNNDPYPVANPFGKLVYYFITDKKWISESCIELTLKLDVINTFAGSYTLSPKTTIIRQHKNRWKNGTSPETKFPLIDLYSEGINPVLYKTRETTLYKQFTSTELDRNSYYLIYRSHTTDENSPIDLFLAFEEIAGIQYIAGEGSYEHIDTLIEFKSSWVGIIYGNDTDGNGYNYSGSIFLKSAINEVSGDKETNITIPITSSTAIVFTRNQLYVGVSSANGFLWTSHYKPYGRINFRDIALQNIFRLRIDTSGGFYPTSSSYFLTLTPSYITGLSFASNIHGSSTTITSYVGTIFDIDRTDPLLLKIIKLPYCPIDIDMGEGNIIEVPTDWEFAQGDVTFPSLLKYRGRNLSQSLEAVHCLVSDGEDYETPYNIFTQTGISAFGKRVSKNKQYETKLLHSDFYLQKFVYDSFSFDFIGEYMGEIDGARFLYVNEYASTTMSSMFMFKMTDFNFTGEEDEFGLKKDLQTYSNTLVISRNNEVPVYNSAYLNYIRTGYNFDIKTKNRQMTSNIISGVAQMAGAVVSAVAGGPIGAVGAVGLGVSAITKLTSTIVTTAQAEQNIQQKLRTAEMQGLSIVGSDDIDLLTVYTNDCKAKLIEYKVSEKMEKMLFDLFYYFGYVANYQGVPDTTSRKVFNYVQADILFDTIPNISNELANEIISKYKEGITFIHHYTLYDNNLQQVRGWDLDQQYENWEVNTSN